MFPPISTRHHCPTCATLYQIPLSDVNPLFFLPNPPPLRKPVFLHFLYFFFSPPSFHLTPIPIGSPPLPLFLCLTFSQILLLYNSASQTPNVPTCIISTTNPSHLICEATARHSTRRKCNALGAARGVPRVRVRLVRGRGGPCACAFARSFLFALVPRSFALVRSRSFSFALFARPLALFHVEHSRLDTPSS